MAETRTRPRREDVRQAILAQALESFERDGYAATTLARIAAASGFTKGAVYSGFGSKAELFAEACAGRFARVSEALMAEVGPALASGGDRAAIVAQVADAITTATLDSPVPWQVLQNEFRAVAMRDDAVRAVYHDFTARRVAILVDLFAANSYLGRLERGALERSAFVVLSLVNALALEHWASPDVVDPGTIRAIATSFLDSNLPRP